MDNFEVNEVAKKSEKAQHKKTFSDSSFLLANGLMILHVKTGVKNFSCKSLEVAGSCTILIKWWCFPFG